MSNTMGGGLLNKNLEPGSGILSPRSVISGARQQVMNNTISGAGLSVSGARKEGWDNPNSSAKNGLGMRETNLSI